MKILYLTTRLPYPVLAGDKIRAYNMLLQLKNLGHHVTLVCLYNDKDNLEEALKHNEIFDEIYPIKFDTKKAYLNTLWALINDKPFIVQYFYSSDMQKQIDKLLKENHFDLITGYMPRIAPYLEKHTDENIMIDLCDAFSMIYKRRVEISNSWFEKLKMFVEYNKMKRYEKKCMKIFKAQTVISERDKKYLESISKKSNIFVVGNGVDTEYFLPQESETKNNICFVGSMQYVPNIEAVTYFINDIFPIIRKSIPDAQFKIIGANPKPALYELAAKYEGIEVTGRVDDTREYVKDCKVSVCPARIAGGVQNKILEAMSMGIPVVTTKEGREGIDAPCEILPVANTKEEYAHKVIEIMQNNELRKSISKQSKEFILNNFSWNKIRDELDNAIKETLNTK